MRSLAAVPKGKRGLFEIGVSREGAEVALGWRPRAGVTLSGYGAGLWGRPWVAGVKGQVIW